MDKYDLEYIKAGIRELENEASSTTLCNDGTSEFLNAVKTNPTLVERLHSPTEEVVWIDPIVHPFSKDQMESSPFCSVSQVSRAFNLNFLQHHVFQKLCGILLMSWNQDITLADSFMSFGYDKIVQKPSDPDNQLRGIVMGEAGSGKSRIFEAVQGFARNWQRQNTVLTTAFTNLAAYNVNGVTMHNAAGVNCFTNTMNPERQNQLRAKMSNVVLILIDEFSMISQSEFTSILFTK
jgi:hypothetical protein